MRALSMGSGRLLLENRPQVFQLVEKVPDIIAGTFLSVRMQVRNIRIVAVVVEGVL